MVEHDVRKLMKLGTASTALILPKKWLEDLGLNPGSLVDLFFDGSSITVAPRTPPQGQPQQDSNMQIFVDISKDGVDVGVQEIVAAYVEGITRVRVRGDEQSISRLIMELNRRITGFLIVSRGKELYDIVVSEFPVDPQHLLSRAIRIVEEYMHALTRKGKDGNDSEAFQTEFTKVYNATMRLVRGRIAMASPEETPPLLDILSMMEKMKELMTLLAIDGNSMPAVALEDLSELFRAATRAVMENNVKKALKVIQFCRAPERRAHATHICNVIIGLAEIAIRRCVRDRACRCKHFFPKVS